MGWTYNRAMKTTRTFKQSWFAFAIVAAIAVGELVAWKLNDVLGTSLNPLTVAAVSTGLVAVATSIIYDGVDIG